MRLGVYLNVLRFGLFAALFLLATFALAQVKDNRLGLTRDQILAMGDDKWFDYFAKQKGESAEALTQACQTYADALHDRNEERLKKEKSRDRLERWYALVKSYGDTMFKIQSRTGGGVWNALEAAQNVDLEELLDQLENLEDKPNPKAPPDLDAASKRVLTHHDVIGKRLAALPTEGLGQLTLGKLNDLNTKGQKRLEGMIPELLKLGGQEAYLVLVTCSKLSDPDALFLAD